MGMKSYSIAQALYRNNPISTYNQMLKEFSRGMVKSVVPINEEVLRLARQQNPVLP